MKNFTPEDLIRYIYKETSAVENELIERQLSQDWTLKAKYEVMKKAYEKLDKMKLMQPRQQVLDRIMAYAAAETNPA